MEITKNMKAGYQGKKDSMRDKAMKLLNHPGHAEDVYKSKSCADNVKIRPYKEGGSVKKDDNKSDKKKSKQHDMECQKFAMGGVAKIRHGEATSQGLPKVFKKKSLKDFL